MNEDQSVMQSLLFRQWDESAWARLREAADPEMLPFIVEQDPWPTFVYSSAGGVSAAVLSQFASKWWGVEVHGNPSPDLIEDLDFALKNCSEASFVDGDSPFDQWWRVSSPTIDSISAPYVTQADFGLSGGVRPKRVVIGSFSALAGVNCDRLQSLEVEWKTSDDGLGKLLLAPSLKLLTVFIEAGASFVLSKVLRTDRLVELNLAGRGRVALGEQRALESLSVVGCAEVVNLKSLEKSPRLREISIRNVRRIEDIGALLGFTKATVIVDGKADWVNSLEKRAHGKVNFFVNRKG